MSSRAEIINAVRAGQPSEIPLPDLSALAVVSPQPDLASFTAILDLIGAHWVRGTDITDAIAWIEANVPASAKIASTVSGLTGNVDLSSIAEPHALDGIHTAIVPGQFGVCENG